MEQTIGKRISVNRKRLGLTQDQLAEKLGVTAQAVSKWENDQSCPDIATLPRLAEIFGITTDELLGRQPQQEALEAVIVEDGEPEESESDGIHLHHGDWEFRWDGGRKNAVGFAVWILSVGILYFLAKWFRLDVNLWNILWPSAIMVFGVFGLYPRLSFFRLGCAIFGGYFLVNNLIPLHFAKGSELIIPLILILWGLSLLADALRKHKKPGIHLYHNGKRVYHKDGIQANQKCQTTCTTEDDSFSCTGSFCDEQYFVDLERLAEGQADVSFGELTVNLAGVKSVEESCVVNANCSFGELVLQVPRRFRVDASKSAAFGEISQSGEPDIAAEGVIHLNADVSFGEIRIQYI